jgi:esterase/lipase superfamily enzyme
MRFFFHKDFVIMLITTSIISYFILISSRSIYGQPAILPLYTSTRNFFDTNTCTLLHSGLSPDPNASSIFNQESNNCPNEIAIYVHGVWASEGNAKEQTERVNLSLNSLNYTIPVIGYTWDSNTPFSIDDTSISQEGWSLAKIIANKNGSLLAKYIIDFKDNCPNSDIRILAHSLGSRVVLSSLEYLSTLQNTF